MLFEYLFLICFSDIVAFTPFICTEISVLTPYNGKNLLVGTVFKIFQFW